MIRGITDIIKSKSHSYILTEKDWKKVITNNFLDDKWVTHKQRIDIRKYNYIKKMTITNDKETSIKE